MEFGKVIKVGFLEIFVFVFVFFVFCVRLGAERRLGIGDYLLCFIMGLWVWDFFFKLGVGFFNLFGC
jgi:hypothetical protein